MRKVLLVLVPIVLLAAGAVGASYLIRTKPQVEPSPPAERVWTVDAVTVRLGDVQPEIQLFGKIFAARQIQVRALVTGQIVKIHPNLVEGGLIRRGEMILAIDEFEYRSALMESEARQAEARARIVEREAKRRAETEALKRDREILALLDRDLKRARQLRKRGNISVQALDKKRLELSRQQRAIVLRRNGIDAEAARLEQEKATIERLDVAVQRARYDLERTRVRAPFDGVFMNVTAQAGQRLGVLDSVGNLIATGRLEARFHISDAQYGRLTEHGKGVIGRRARVTWRVGQRKLELKAVIARVGAQIDTASGGVELFARIEDREAASSLRPGAFVEVHIPDRVYANVARVPETVLHPGNVVYGVEDGRLVARKAKIVGRVGNDVSPARRVVRWRAAGDHPVRRDRAGLAGRAPLARRAVETDVRQRPDPAVRAAPQRGQPADGADLHRGRLFAVEAEHPVLSRFRSRHRLDPGEMAGRQHRGYRSQYPGGDRARGAVPGRRRPGDLLRDGRRGAGHRRIRGGHRHAVGAVGSRGGAAADHHSAGGQRAAGGAPHRALRHDRATGACRDRIPKPC